MSWFDEDLKRILEELGWSEEVINEFLRPSFIQKPWIVSSEKDRIQYDLFDRGKFLEVVVELPIYMKARKLEELEYKIKVDKLLIKDKLGEKSIVAKLPYNVEEKPIEKPTYVNRVFDIKLKKIESYEIPIK